MVELLEKWSRTSEAQRVIAETVKEVLFDSGKIGGLEQFEAVIQQAWQKHVRLDELPQEPLGSKWC